MTMWLVLRGVLEMAVGLAGLVQVFAGVASLSGAVAKFCNALDDVQRAGVVFFAVLTLDAIYRLWMALYDGFGPSGSNGPKRPNKPKKPKNPKVKTKSHLNKKPA